MSSSTPARRFLLDENVRAELDTELARRLIDVERVASAELDELVARRLDLIDTELRALAAEEG